MNRKLYTMWTLKNNSRNDFINIRKVDIRAKNYMSLHNDKRTNTSRQRKSNVNVPNNKVAKYVKK